MVRWQVKSTGDPLEGQYDDAHHVGAGKAEDALALLGEADSRYPSSLSLSLSFLSSLSLSLVPSDKVKAIRYYLNAHGHNLSHCTTSHCTTSLLQSSLTVQPLSLYNLSHCTTSLL